MDSDEIDRQFLTTSLASALKTGFLPYYPVNEKPFEGVAIKVCVYITVINIIGHELLLNFGAKFQR